jgi:hypothetical protein
LSNSLITKCLCDIINGYSTTVIDSTTVFLKHFNTFDQLKIDEYYEAKLQEGISKGLFTEEIRLAELRRAKIWTKKDDEEEKGYQIELEGALKTRKLQFAKEYIDYWDSQIREFSKNVTEKTAYKNQLVGKTAEKFAKKLSYYYEICQSLYKNIECNIQYLDKENFNEIDDEELLKVIKNYEKEMAHLDGVNIKKAALSYSFQNLYSSCNDNPYYFFGTPISRLTFTQSFLFNHGRYYSKIFRELGNIPEKVKNDPEKLEDYYTQTTNREREKAKYAGKGGVTEFMGQNDTPTERDYAEAEMLQKGFSGIQAIERNIL